MMRIDWDESSINLKKLLKITKSYPPALFVSEKKFRWNTFHWKNFNFYPEKKQVHIFTENKEFEFPSIVTSKFLVREHIEDISKYDYMDVIFSNLQIGPAFASILSFCLECLVLTYPRSGPVVTFHEDQIFVTEYSWTDMIEEFLGRQVGLTDSGETFMLPEEERFYHDRLKKILDILTNCEGKLYYNILRAMRFYQYALYNSRLDLNVTYSFLVQAIDVISSVHEDKIQMRMKDIDPKGYIKNALKKIGMYEEKYGNVSSVMTYGTLTEQIIRFIMKYLSDDFWERDHSPIRSIKDSFTRDLQREKERIEFIPEDMKERWKKMYKFREKSLERIKERRKPPRFFNNESRNALIRYYKEFPDRVLRNTFAARSSLFHFGQSFPSYSLESPLGDWIPEIQFSEEDDFRISHFGHGPTVTVNDTGKVWWECTCGEKREIKIHFSLICFERMVHDSMLNFIIKEIANSTTR